jgi:hypothetical protein
VTTSRTISIRSLTLRPFVMVGEGEGKVDPFEPTTAGRTAGFEQGSLRTAASAAVLIEAQRNSLSAHRRLGTALAQPPRLGD